MHSVAKDMDIHSYRVPLGVTAGFDCNLLLFFFMIKISYDFSIAPFNFPAMIPLWVRIEMSE